MPPSRAAAASPSPPRPAAAPAPFHRVLVATDLSAQAALALRRAALLPLAAGARIELIHVLPEPRPGSRAHAPRPLRRKLMDEIDALDAQLIRGGLHDAKLRQTIAHGETYEEILRHARAMRAELVVLGRHGTGGAGATLLGSTAERVVRGRVAPVLVVTTAADAPYARPLVALDPEDAAARALLGSALRLVDPGAARIELVTAYKVALEGWLRAGDVPPSTLAQLRKRAAKAAHEAITKHAAALRDNRDVRAHVHVRSGDARAVILRTIDRRRPDLVVLGTHARGALARFLLGSVAVEVLRSAQVDVAIVPPPG